MRTLLVLAVVVMSATTASRKPEPVEANRNLEPAGTLHGRILTLQLEARAVRWTPLGQNDPAYVLHAFAERGKVAQIPGPFIRVAAGTTVSITIRNTLALPLKIGGLHARPLAGASDTIVIAPGETGTATFTLTVPGTYFYWGATTDTGRVGRRLKRDSQLAGAILVDDPARAPDERVFVISQFADSIDPATGTPAEGTTVVSVINGESWPNTEKFTRNVGDKIRWRWINVSNAVHPMHLHGFYFTVEGRGDVGGDTVYAAAARRQVVTERMAQGTTMLMSWQPDRAGNWLFHCHVPAHIAPRRTAQMVALKGSDSHANHAMEGMAGLVIGVHVLGPDHTDADREKKRRELRMMVEADSGGTAEAPAFRFRLDQPDEFARSGIGVALNPVLVVRKGEPVGIMLVNKLGATTAVHWHGIELESYFDGVAGFGGIGSRISPVIQPDDSFHVRFTPPRAGTFIYHTHVDEEIQEPAGLSGALVVIEPDATFDARTDHVVLITTPRIRGKQPRVSINNSVAPAPLVLRAGEPQRFRFINMTLAPPRGFAAVLVQDTTVMKWKPVAKDGMDLPAHQAAIQPARMRLSTGETYDFATTFAEPGDYRLEVRDLVNPRLIVGVLPIQVRKAD